VLREYPCMSVLDCPSVSDADVYVVVGECDV
jgi:hypothetical protein